LLGLKFRRQHPLHHFVLDFYCPEWKLAIELDGDAHASNVRADTERTEALARFGVTVLRFSNRDVLQTIDSVLETIVAAVDPLALEGEGWGEGDRASSEDGAPP
jgi:very-short-patch-repair endonuclease